MVHLAMVHGAMVHGAMVHGAMVHGAMVHGAMVDLAMVHGQSGIVRPRKIWGLKTKASRIGSPEVRHCPLPLAGRRDTF